TVVAMILPSVSGGSSADCSSVSVMPLSLSISSLSAAFELSPAPQPDTINSPRKKRRKRSLFFISRFHLYYDSKFCKLKCLTNLLKHHMEAGSELSIGCKRRTMLSWLTQPLFS